jgi:hypothetical protein
MVKTSEGKDMCATVLFAPKMVAYAASFDASNIMSDELKERLDNAK